MFSSLKSDIKRTVLYFFGIINELYTLLKKYECLFDGNIGIWHGKPYDIKLKPDAEPYHVKPLPVPLIHELTFKKNSINSSILR